MQHVARCVAVAVSSAGLLAACSPATPAPAGPPSAESPSSSSSEVAPARASALELADGSRVVLAGEAPEAIGDIGYGGTLVLLDGGYGTPEDAEWRAVAPGCFEGRRGIALVGIEVTG